MKVLQVIDSLALGGAERSTVAMLPQLAERGIEVELATLKTRPGLQDEVRSHGVPLHELSTGGGWPGWFGRLRTVTAERVPDLVHTSLYLSDVIGRSVAASCAIPVVSTMPTERYGAAHLGGENMRRWKVRANQTIDATTARLTKRLHAVSHQVADATAANLWYPRDRIDVVYRGRASSLAHRDPDDRRRARLRVRRELGLDLDRPVALVLARHDPAKGIDRVIEAMPWITARVPSVRLLVAGPPSQHTPGLERRAAELGLGATVSFIGQRSDVADVLAASDAFVLGSRREGLPGALLEAMASGLPAVVADLPQVLEVAGPDEARVVDAAEPDRLAEGVVETLVDQEAAQERAKRARARFLRDFTMDRAADGLVAFYERSVA